MKTTTIKCNFKNNNGHILDARLDAPRDIAVDDITQFIVFCHCFTCTKETITTFRLSRLLAENGYGVLRFDFTGLGSSEGDFAETTFITTQDDIRSAIHFLEKNYSAPGFLMGHSLGGTTALSVADEFDSVLGVVSVASPSKPDHVLHHFGHALTQLEQGIATRFEVAGQYYDIEPAFIDNVRKTDMTSLLKRLDKPVLIVNIDGDTLVSEENAQQIQQWTSGKSSRINILGSDHLLSNREATIEVADEIVRWIESVIGETCLP